MNSHNKDSLLQAWLQKNSPIPWLLRASMWCFWSLLARIPPWMLGCKVLTRPSSFNTDLNRLQGKTMMQITPHLCIFHRKRRKVQAYHLREASKFFNFSDRHPGTFQSRCSSSSGNNFISTVSIKMLKRLSWQTYYFPYLKQLKL